MTLKKKILTLLFAITSILLLIISYNIVKHIIIFNDHRQYFELPIEEQTVKSWMSLNYIEKTYNINFEVEFGKQLGIWSKNASLENYCEKYELNCDEFIIILDEHKNGN